MFSGSIVALVTPMSESGQIDYDALERLVEFHVGQGTHGIVSVGTTGESATLNVSEHTEVIRRTIKCAAGRIPVIAGTGANATDEAIELTQSAADAGADAALLVTPYYNKPPQEGLYQHYRAVADAVDLPQILYNVPGRTGCDLLPETVERLADIENIVAIKEATGTAERIRELLDRCGDRLVVLSGDDGTAAESILAGARGDISVTANVAPRRMAELCEAALAGDADTVRDLDARLQPLHEAMFVEPNPIPVKWALSRMGLIPPGIRLPLVPLDDRFHAQVESALQSLELI